MEAVCLAPLVQRGRDDDLQHEQRGENPVRFVDQVAQSGFVGDHVRMNRGPDAEPEGDDAAEQNVGGAPTRWVRDKGGSNTVRGAIVEGEGEGSDGEKE